jgi:Tfp pilus assembly protein PilO
MEKYILQLGEMTWGKIFVAGLVIAGLYWALYYDDGSTLTTNIQSLNQQYSEAERQLRETKEAMADAEQFERAVRQNEVQFEKVLEYLPSEMNANELTRMITQQIQISGGEVVSTKAQPNIEKRDFYEMTRLEFVIKGSFSQVVLFLSSLSKVQRLLTFDKLSIRLDQSRAGQDTASPSVDLQGVVVGYRYLKDATADGGGSATAP